jgi:hypothetical protein
MFSLNLSLLIKLIPILILFGMVSSCGKKPEVVFRYSNGREIKDSTAIRFLTKQLQVEMPEYDSTKSQTIQTFLDPKIEREVNRYIDSGSDRKVSGMMILENKTGNVVYWKNSEKLLVYSQRFQTMKMYGILLSLEKGVKLTDTYSWIGKYSRKKYDSTVSRLYRMSAPSLEYKYPFDDYSCSQWSAFLKQLDVSENERDCADGEIYPRYYFRTSLFDLVKTGVLIHQNGTASANNLFGTVKGSGGKILHKAAFVKGRRLKTDTCLSAKKVLKRDPFDIIEFSYPIFLFTHGEIRNGMVLSSEKYTIGFLSDSKSGSNGFVTKEIYTLVSLLENLRH